MPSACAEKSLEIVGGWSGLGAATQVVVEVVSENVLGGDVIHAADEGLAELGRDELVQQSHVWRGRQAEKVVGNGVLP